MSPRPYVQHPVACGATTPLVLGRCGRDAGHDGAHRSTGDTFEAWWDDTPVPPPPDRPAPAPNPVIPSQ